MALSYSLISHFKAKLVIKAENALKSKRLVNFSFDGSTNTIRATVHASMKDKNYQVEIALNDTCNSFVSKKCQCPNGLASCHHMVVACLHAIKYVSSTDKTCLWKQPKVAERVTPVEELFSTKNDISETVYQPLKRNPDANDKDWLLQSLKELDQFNGALWLLSETPQSEDSAASPISTFPDITTGPEYVAAENKVNYVLNAMKVSEQEIDLVQDATQGQRGNLLWGKIREGRITSSVFGSVIKCVNNGRRPPSLFKKLKGGYNLEGVKSIQWGMDHEEDGIKGYEKVTGNKVLASGLILHTSGVLGASPDGLVGHDTIIEVKCPFSMVKTTVKEGTIASKTPFLSLDEQGTFSLNLKSQQGWNYYHQVQGCMYLANRVSCDFVVWTPKDCQVFKIAKEDAWQENIEKLLTFYKTSLLPELL